MHGVERVGVAGALIENDRAVLEGRPEKMADLLDDGLVLPPWHHATMPLEIR